jgi:hypothetical protein
LTKLKSGLNADKWVAATIGKYASDPVWEESRNRLYCLDCGLHVISEGHYCMLRTPVWRRTGLGPFDGVLCLDHIERRIGRRLRLNDFLIAKKSDEGAFSRGEPMLPEIWEQYVARRDAKRIKPLF